MITHSAEETIKAGEAFGKSLKPNAVVCFFGDLGAGKTTFIKGMARGFQKPNVEIEVNSPTFTYLNIYQGDVPLYHFDLYRLKDVDEFLMMGFDEVLEAGGISCIEWSERLVPLDMSNYIKVEISHLGGDSRSINIKR